MRTLIRGGWIVGFQGETHALVRDGVVVFEDGSILHVGADFDGDVDREIDARGMLVAPGFIDMHVHGRPSGVAPADYRHRPAGLLRPAVPGDQRAGGRGRGRRGIRGTRGRTRPGANEGTDLHATFTVTELLRNGVTTFMEIGSQLRVQEGLLGEVDRLGARAYLGPGFDSGRWVADPKGRLKRAPDEAAGWREFEGAVDFIKRSERQLRRPGPGDTDPAGVRELHAGSPAGHAEGGGRAQGPDIDPRGL